MKQRQRKERAFCLNLIYSTLVLLGALILSDPVILISLQKMGGSTQEMKMCTCSTCREGPGECHCSMSHMPGNGPVTGEKQICSCNTHGTASMMMDYYFPRFFPQTKITILTHNTIIPESTPLENNKTQPGYLSDIFHPPKG